MAQEPRPKKPATAPVRLTEHELMEVMVDLIETKKLPTSDDDRRARIDGILGKVDSAIIKVRGK